MCHQVDVEVNFLFLAVTCYYLNILILGASNTFIIYKIFSSFLLSLLFEFICLKGFEKIPVTITENNNLGFLISLEAFDAHHEKLNHVIYFMKSTPSHNNQRHRLAHSNIGNSNGFYCIKSAYSRFAPSTLFRFS